MKHTFEAIYEIVRQIPAGRVCTYGGIALLAGNPRGARIVGYAMRACTDATVPCHRVLHHDGSLSAAFIADGIQRQELLLKKEGVAFLPDGKADLTKHLWPRFSASQKSARSSH